MILHDFMFKGHSFDQTSKYLNMWENDSPYGCPDNIKLKDVFCLPQVSFLKHEYDNTKAKSANVEKVFDGLISQDIKILAINGRAGSGKTVLLSYWINRMVLSKTNGIMVFSSFKKNIERILCDLMPKLSEYAKLEGLSSFTVAIEDIDLNYENKYSQKQFVYQLSKITRLYTNINFIITGRQLLTDALRDFAFYINIDPFNHSQIMYVVKRVDKALRLKSPRADIEKLQDILGEWNINNPLILMYILGNGALFEEVNSLSEFYCSILDNPRNKEVNQMASVIAWEMFKSGDSETALDINSRYIKENASILVESSSGKLRFINKSIYDFYLARYITNEFLSYCSNEKDNHSKIRKMLGYQKIEEDVLEHIKTLLGKNSNLSGIVYEKIIDDFAALLGDDLLIRDGSFLKEARSLVIIFYNQYSIIHSVFNSYEYIGSLLSGKQKEAFWLYIRMYSAFFKEADLDFSNIVLKYCDLSGLNLANIDMSNCVLDGCILNDTNLSGATFNHASMRRTCLRDAVMKAADLSYADFSQSDLRGANLKRCNCVSVNFRGASLKGSSLEMADCGYCNFEYADLSEANCSNTNFKKTRFINTNLLSTVLVGAEFEDSVLENVYIMT